MSHSFIIFFSLFFFSFTFLLTPPYTSAQEEQQEYEKLVESPYIPFCKNRLSETDFRDVKLYEKTLLSLPSSSSGPRLIELLHKSIVKDEKNRYRNGGFKVLQNDDHRMKEVDDLIFKNNEIEKVRKELRRSNQKAFHCVDEFEMMASGRALVEDLETGRPRNVRSSGPVKFHRYDDFSSEEEDGENDETDEEEEAVMKKPSATNSVSKSREERYRDLHLEQQRKDNLRSSSGTASFSHDKSEEDTDFVSNSGGHHSRYHGMHPNEIHLFTHATQHFRRHEEAKLAHQRHNDQILHQRRQRQHQQVEASKAQQQQQKQTTSPSATSLTPEQQQSMKQSFDHMQNHFQQHHHQMAAQKRMIEESTRKMQQKHQERLEQEKVQFDKERIGAELDYEKNMRKKTKKIEEKERRELLKEMHKKRIEQEESGKYFNPKLHGDPVNADGFERIDGPGRRRF